jgi:hypothetical protein
MRQVRLALGREADRVERVMLVDDAAPLDGAVREAFAGTAVVRAAGAAGTPGDRMHIYLIDPHGNVILRWPAQPDYRRMKGDLDRLLRASQIG